MRLKGITTEGMRRIAKAIQGQGEQLEPGFGFGMEDSGEEIITWDFDLTTYGTAENFQKFLDTFNLEYAGRGTFTGPGDEVREGGFLWKGPGLTVDTNNNPITGEHYDPRMRQPEEGYASYITFEGEESLVEAAVKLTKELGGTKEDFGRSG